MFAKIFGPDEDQVLVKIDTGENNNPEVRVYFKPEGLGVCSFSCDWDDDSDESWELAERYFNIIKEQDVRDIINQIIAELDE